MYLMSSDFLRLKKEWIESIFDMVDYYMLAVLAPCDGDDVEAELLADAVALDIFVGGAPEMAYLRAVDSVLGFGDLVGGACLHLHEDHRGVVRCETDDVEVAAAAPEDPVALHDDIALLL